MARSGRGPRGRRLGIVAAVLSLLVIAAGVIGVMRGDIRLSGGGQPTAAVTPPGSSSPVASSLPSPSSSGDPFPSGSAFFDTLTKAGNWQPSKVESNFDSSCAIHGGLVVAIAGYSSYRCGGYVTNVTDFAAAVDITLMRAASCASIWFHFTGQDGPQHGYALLICPDGVELRTHTDKAAGGGDLIGTSDAAVWPPLPLNTSTHVTMSVVDNYLTVSRDGVTVLQQVLTDYRVGRLILGIYQPKPRTGVSLKSPPDGSYEVRFNNLHIWTPAGGGSPSASPGSPIRSVIVTPRG